MKTRHWLKTICASAAGAALLMATPPAMAERGGASTGGGNSTSDRMQRVLDTFGENSVKMKASLKAFIFQVSNFPPQGQYSALIQDLITQGIKEDIEKSEYVFSKKCLEDGDDDPKDASTLRGVRNAPVCINIPKLATEGSTPDEIVGLLMHEHARHFGVEDTTEFGLHPLAKYVTERFQYLQTDCRAKEILSPGHFERVRKEWHRSGNLDPVPDEVMDFCSAEPRLKDLSMSPFFNRFGGFIIFSTAPKNVSLVFDLVEGECPDSSNLKTGSRVSLGEAYYIDHRVNPGLFGLHSISKTCKVSLSLESPYGKVPLVEKASYREINGFIIFSRRVDLTDNRPPGLIGW